MQLLTSVSERLKSLSFSTEFLSPIYVYHLASESVNFITLCLTVTPFKVELDEGKCHFTVETANKK